MNTIEDFSRPNNNRSPCSNGWYALPRNNHACRKCGSRLGQQCKAKESNATILLIERPTPFDTAPAKRKRARK